MTSRTLEQKYSLLNDRVAKKMLEKGYDIIEISEMTVLFQEDIEALKEEPTE